MAYCENEPIKLFFGQYLWKILWLEPALHWNGGSAPSLEGQSIWIPVGNHPCFCIWAAKQPLLLFVRQLTFFKRRSGERQCTIFSYSIIFVLFFINLFLHHLLNYCLDWHRPCIFKEEEKEEWEIFYLNSLFFSILVHVLCSMVLYSW